ncbi:MULTISPECIES: hypothetical protein [Cyanophyceae]|uniref:hypothetical protein n=1 Tax=Cyanophyceae TaxID=3028117 RepID=UPI0016847332|nr:hypothetical protein [Trichocoleus sp. FACHB-69]MBD1833305.1 hypothetical protein [Cyanobacteria bacterium FACHB-472]MBD1930322.1 hypothetical protein [Trichocoleus sp. FACHB-69]
MTNIYQKVAFTAASAALSLGVFSLTNLSSVQAFDIFPSDARGLRFFPFEEPLLLDFLAVNKVVDSEDRSVFEYNISQLALNEFSSVKLRLEAGNIDEEGSLGFLDVFTFTGDGIVSPNDFFAGSFFTTFEASSSLNIVSIDITDLVISTLATGNPFLGVRLSTATSDRYTICGGSLFEILLSNCLLIDGDEDSELGPPRLSIAPPTPVHEPMSPLSLLAFGAFYLLFPKRNRDVGIN